MKPEERSMILDLFDRIAAAPQDSNDRDAERLIREAVASVPNAPYVLVQTVLLQEEALRRADERIRALQDAAADRGERESQSFLGSGRRLGQASGGGSVPNAGARQDDPDSLRRAGDTRYAEPMRGQPAQPIPQSVPPAGGGFLSSALSTAGGVASGMLLADGIRSLFGGSHAGGLWGGAPEAKSSTADSKAESSSVDWAARDKAQDDQQDADDEQDALQDAEDDQDDFGGDDSDSMDV